MHQKNNELTSEKNLNQLINRSNNHVERVKKKHEIQKC